MDTRNERIGELEGIWGNPKIGVKVSKRNVTVRWNAEMLRGKGMPELQKRPASTWRVTTYNEGQDWPREVNSHVLNAAIRIASERIGQFSWKNRRILSGRPKKARKGEMATRKEEEGRKEGNVKER